MNYPVAVAVPVGDQWQSLAPRVDIASQGDTAEEAIEMVLDAVRGVEEYIADHPEGQYELSPTPWEDFAEFMRDATAPYVVVKLEVGP